MADKKLSFFGLPPIIKKHQVSLGFFLVGLAIFSGGVVLSYSKASEKSGSNGSFSDASVKIITPSSSPAPKKILVDVSGAVVLPGVYQLPAGSRLELALQAAGGLGDEADGEYIAENLNLASVLTDGTKVYIPKKGQTVFQQGSEASAKKVNINKASASELETLSGIGPKTAEKIIAGRPYQQVEDLLLRKIIGQSVFAKIKEEVGI